jgi:multiple sugar transport system ATP-binding protein
MTMADKIVVMQNGHIEQVGSPLELYDSPTNTFVAGFIGSPAMNMIKASVSIDPIAGPQALIGKACLNLPAVASLKAGQEILIGIRPENLLPAADGLAGEITVIEPTGSETHVVVRSDGQDFVSVLRERPEYQPGQSIKLSAAAEDLHVFDAERLLRLNYPR